MTVSALFEKGKKALADRNIENSVNEARWIFEAVFNVNSQFVYMNSDSEADVAKAKAYLEKINRRAQGEPVQYVIGSWDFYGREFSVGKGVLIPRPETELLVDFALDFLKSIKEPVVFDLCAGSGCIGLTVADIFPDARVFLLEKSSDAFAYLSENKKKLSCNNATLVSGDIFDGFKSFDLPLPDLILSNPPYIESEEISSLQSEVLKEPVMALDGGADGFMFYRAVSEKWLPYCKGAIAVECGENQHDDIIGMFSNLCGEMNSVKDFNGIDRVVCGLIDLGKGQ